MRRPRTVANQSARELAAALHFVAGGGLAACVCVCVIGKLDLLDTLTLHKLTISADETAVAAAAATTATATTTKAVATATKSKLAKIQTTRASREKLAHIITN